jgi:hypothetical protein
MKGFYNTLQAVREAVDMEFSDMTAWRLRAFTPVCVTDRTIKENDKGHHNQVSS